jgi:hypothetical protein
VREALDRLGCVVLCLGDTSLSGKVVDLDNLGLAALGCENHLERALAGNDAVLGAVLVAESVTADNDGLFPAGHETGNGGDDDGRTEDGSSSTDALVSCFLNACINFSQVVTDGAVGRQPHLLELELLDSLLIGCDGGTLDTNRVLLDCLGSIEGDLVVGLITVGQAKVVVLEVDVQVRVNKLRA